MTREDIENLVVEATGRTDKTTLIRSAINLALDEVSSKNIWMDLQVEDDVTITTGAASVNLADDVARVSEIRVIDGTSSYPLLVRDKKWLTDRIPNVSALSTARPCYGYLEGRTLYVMRLPNQDYTIRYTYTRLHPAFTGSSDTLLIRALGAAVAAWATYWVFLSIEKIKEAEIWFATYEKHLATAIKLDQDDSVVDRRATPRNRYGRNGEPLYTQDYWLDPFARSMP